MENSISSSRVAVHSLEVAAESVVVGIRTQQLIKSRKQGRDWRRSESVTCDYV